ncbi:MAG: hypothetical protein A2053_06325 [Deltaproteobacteria bacterium GWA2_50_8]|nr:MAG: hypothetical protein A2053_06325 [Deltaproteobacteria bacterium GWA2_50_8]
MFEKVTEHIQPKAIHAAVQPKANHVQAGLAYLGVAPVQVWLLWVKHVVIILATFCIPFPAWCAKNRFPVIGQAAIGFGIPPDVPIGIWIVFALARLLKPQMLIGGVVEHQVKDHPDTALMRLCNQTVKISQGAKFGIDIRVVTDIVSEVNVRRGVKRRIPDGFDAQFSQVVQVLDHSSQVANTVAIAVGKGSRVNLIDHTITPPDWVCCHDLSRIDWILICRKYSMADS